MGTLRLRLKFGPHEFEAEGDPDAVRLERDAWLASRMKAGSTPTLPPQTSITGIVDSTGEQTAESLQAEGSDTTALEPVFRPDGKGNLSLMVLLPGADREGDGALLLLFGYRELLKLPEVSAVRLMSSLKTSGYPIKRLDRTMGRLKSEGSVLSQGLRRAMKYRLSNSGEKRARELAYEVVQHL